MEAILAIECATREKRPAAKRATILKAAADAASAMTEATRLSFARTDPDTLVVRVAGDWSIDQVPPRPVEVDRQLAATPAPRRVTFDASALGEWDSILLTFLLQVGEMARQRGIAVDRSGLPGGVQELLTIAETVPEREDAHVDELKAPALDRLGIEAIEVASSVGGFVRKPGAKPPISTAPSVG